VLQSVGYLENDSTYSILCKCYKILFSQKYRIETLETPSSAPSFALTVQSGGVCNRVGGRIPFLSSPSALTDEAIQPSLATLQVETDPKNREQEVYRDTIELEK
jgi:hypothetical protein